MNIIQKMFHLWRVRNMDTACLPEGIGMGYGVVQLYGGVLCALLDGHHVVRIQQGRFMVPGTDTSVMIPYGGNPVIELVRLVIELDDAFVSLVSDIQEQPVGAIELTFADPEPLSWEDLVAASSALTEKVRSDITIKGPRDLERVEREMLTSLAQIADLPLPA